MLIILRIAAKVPGKMWNESSRTPTWAARRFCLRLAVPAHSLPTARMVSASGLPRSLAARLGTGCSPHRLSSPSRVVIFWRMPRAACVCLCKEILGSDLNIKMEEGLHGQGNTKERT